MMRKSLFRTLTITLLVAAVVMAAGVAYGQGITALPGGGWWTSAGIQNVGSDTAQVGLTAYHLSGGATDTHSASFTIAEDGAVTFMPGGTTPNVDVSPVLESGFAGSMVIASDQPLVAIGQVGNNQVGSLGVSGGYASGLYRGLSAGAATISFPVAKSNYGGKTSTYYVQATGTDTSITATVKTNDGATHTAKYSISANKSVVVNMSDFTPAIATSSCGSGDTSPCFGAITVVAAPSGTIAGVAVETDTSVSPATRAQVASMFDPVNDADTTVYCPLFKYNWANRHTGVTVQNVSGGAANVYGTFVASAGASGTYKSSYTGLANGSSYTFMGMNNNVGGFPINAMGAVVFTSTGKIIASVNEANFNAAPYKATTYTCFAGSRATQKIAFPQVKEIFGVNTTGVTIQNVGAGTATINAVYTCSGVPYTAAGISVDPGKQFTYYKPSQAGSGVSWIGTPLPSNKNCGVVVTANQNIVGVAQEAATTSLDTKNYEGFNLTP